MKKSPVLCLSTVVLTSVLSAAIGIAAPAQEQGSFAELVPESAMVVISIPDAGELKAILEDTAYIKILEAAAFMDAVQEALSEVGSKFYEETGVELRELYDAVTGDLTFVMLDADFKGKYEFALLLGMPEGKNYYDLLIGKALEKEKEGYQPVRLFVDDVEVIQADKNVFFAFYAGHVVMTTSENATAEIVRGTKTLAQSPTFKQHLDICKMTGGIVLHVNVAQILERTMSGAPGEGGELEQLMPFILEMYGILSLNSVSLSLPLREGEPARMFLECPNCKGIFTEWFSAEPVGTEGATLLPGDTESFLAVSISRPTVILDSLVKWMNKAVPGYDEIFNTLEKEMPQMLGLNLREDLLEPFGTKLFIGMRFEKDAAIDDINDFQAFFKAFNFTFLLKLANPDRLANSIDTLIAGGALPAEKEDYDGVTIFSTAIPGAGLELWYTLHKSYLFLCLSKQALTGAIDLVASGDTLDKNGDFQKAVGAIPGQACLIGYSSKALFAKQLEMVISMMKQKEGRLSAEQLDGLMRAVLEYVGAETEGTVYAIPMENGLYIQMNTSYRRLAALVPVLVQYFMHTFYSAEVFSPII